MYYKWKTQLLFYIENFILDFYSLENGQVLQYRQGDGVIFTILGRYKS